MARMFLALGAEGLERLDGLLGPAKAPMNQDPILKTIYVAQTQQLLPLEHPVEREERRDIRHPKITDEMASQARDIFENIVARMRDDEWMRALVLRVWMASDMDRFFTRVRGKEDQFENVTTDIFTIMTESSIAISRRMIAEFRNLIARDEREEEYQQFLKEHPVFLAPLAKHIIPKHALGNDYITDFVVETLDGQYMLVEIEKPSDQIFVKRDDFSATFSHALGQVLDFQQWIEANHAYADTKLPGVTSPSGLLVMDRRAGLSAKQQEKLGRLNTTMKGSIRVCCYDDVLSDAERLYYNIHRK